MKKLITIITILTLTYSSKAQSKETKNDTLAVFSYQDAIKLLQWVDATNEPNQSVKSIEQFIQKHIQIIPAVADKPKK